jgi:hypothetical protein
VTDRSPQQWYVDAVYPIPDSQLTSTGVFGPYEMRRMAEQTMANLAARPDVITATIRPAQEVATMNLTDLLEQEVYRQVVVAAWPEDVPPPGGGMIP